MTIAKKHAQSYMPNGEVSLEQVIQAAIDEDRRDIARHIDRQQERIRQLEAEQVPDGWAFSSADFSLVASGRGDGRVALQRDEAGMKWWHSLPQELKDDDNGPALYVVGRGMTFTDAMNDACQKAMLAAAPAQEKL